jgi:single-strand DNA-binding protein
MGNLTRDPELRTTPKGATVCQFSVAVNRSYKDETGTVKEEVNFFDVEAWGKPGQTISKFLAKGRPIFLQGRLKQGSWEDKNTGQKRNRVFVVLENFQFLGTKPAGDTAPTNDKNADKEITIVDEDLIN